ncbi:uncharacterized protein PG998_010997 [Apiospora kogelbergensis]|uniref:Uncharacterized protein n=1 Tax=Apiospora kogelbergensis TaxID=1337665 RepID=A0AAW0RDC0_9PEZI
MVSLIRSSVSGNTCDYPLLVSLGRCIPTGTRSSTRSTTQQAEQQDQPENRDQIGQETKGQDLPPSFAWTVDPGQFDINDSPVFFWMKEVSDVKDKKLGSQTSAFFNITDKLVEASSTTIQAPTTKASPLAYLVPLALPSPSAAQLRRPLPRRQAKVHQTSSRRT